MMPSKKRKADDLDPSAIITTKRRKVFPISVTKIYYVAPTYTKCGDMCGGCKSSAILGPRAYREQNSDADSKLPKGILKARETYPHYSFKAGHLLNATLGGSGTDSKNLIILTASANVKCNTFDNKMKAALHHLLHVYESLSAFCVDITKISFGIKVDIVVDKATWGKAIPDCYIHTGMHMKAVVWGTLQVNNLPDSNGANIALSSSQLSELVGHISAFRNAVSEVADFVVTNSK